MRIVTNSADLRRHIGGRHQVEVVDDEAVLEWYDPETYGVVIVDVDKAQGVYSPRVIRENSSNLPVIGISEDLPYGADWADQRATFIEQGGSYLLKAPINPRELFACITELKRRFESVRPKIIMLERRLLIDTVQRLVSFDGYLVPLTGQENRIFMDLADHIGSVRTKDNLFSALYSLQNDDVEIKIIDVFICKIRAKFDRIVPNLGPALIQTVWGQGYKLVEPVLETETEVA